MLPPAYQWLTLSDGLLLRFNYRGVATIASDGSGVIRWHDGRYAFRCRDQATARAYVEHWVLAKNDLPARRRSF